MSSSTISCVRLPVLLRSARPILDVLGRSGLTRAKEAGSRETCASPRRLLAVTTSSGKETARHPRTPSSRPEADDLAELLIRPDVAHPIGVHHTTEPAELNYLVGALR